jgi:hypothetical protein
VIQYFKLRGWFPWRQSETLERLGGFEKQMCFSSMNLFTLSLALLEKIGITSKNVLQSDRIFFFRIEGSAVLTALSTSMQLRWFFHEYVLEYSLPHALFPQTAFQVLSINNI